jgi:hypothetical protein
MEKKLNPTFQNSVDLINKEILIREFIISKIHFLDCSVNFQCPHNIKASLILKGIALQIQHFHIGVYESQYLLQTLGGLDS